MSVNKFKLSISGRGFGGCSKPPVTFDDVLKHIHGMELGEKLAMRLTDKARTMPPGALAHFLKNINTYVATLSRKKDDD